MGGNRIHVTLDDDDLVVLPDRHLGQVESEEEAALVEYHRLGRVEILRHRVAESPAAKADDAALPRADREEEAVAEPVAVATAFSLAKEPGFRCQRGNGPKLIQIAAERIAIGGVTQAELLRDLGRDTALPEQIATGDSRRGVAQ